MCKNYQIIFDKNTSKSLKFIQNPGSLVGRDVSHKFKVDETGEIRWYHGTVIGYDLATKLHQIEYEDEEEHCYFDLTLDLLNGDLKVLN